MLSRSYDEWGLCDGGVVVGPIQFLDYVSVGDVIISVGGIVTFATILIKVRPLFQNVSNFLDDWAGEPPRQGYRGRPGVMQRLESLESQLNPDSGKSLYDKITATVDEVEALKIEVYNLNSRFEEHIDKVDQARIEGHREGQELFRAIGRLAEENTHGGSHSHRRFYRP